MIFLKKLPLFDKLKEWLIRRAISSGQVFILPTKMGWWYLSTLIVLVIMGIGYQNNICLGLFFILLSLLMIWAVEAHLNLASYQLSYLSIQDEHLGHPHQIKLSFKDSPANNQHLSIFLEGQHLELNNNRGHLYFSQRGPVRVDSFKLISNYPLDLFKTWRYIKCSAQLWVYPEITKDYDATIGLSDDLKANLSTFSNTLEGDFLTYKNSEETSSFQRISWKLYAKTGKLFEKEYSTTKSNNSIIHVENAKISEYELSCITTLVTELYHSKASYQLFINGRIFDSGDELQEQLRLLSEVICIN